MKRCVLFLVFMGSLCVHAQLLVNVQAVPGGIHEKSQLWNLFLTNTAATPINLQIQLALTDNSNSVQVLSATTKSIVIQPGTVQLSNALLQPVQYNVLAASYAIDASANGLLPIGNFEACYSFFATRLDATTKIAEECLELVVEPFSPPSLIAPVDQSSLDDKHPQLTWLPPVPVNLFSNLKYDLQLTEVLPNQSASDAIDQNIPFFHQQSIGTTTIFYPLNAPALEVNKQYAWRVIAKSNNAPIGQSQTWSFSIKPQAKADSIGSNDMPYVELKKEPSGYAIFSKALKFKYVNESDDSLLHAVIYDLTAKEKQGYVLPAELWPLKPGLNLIQCPIAVNSFFVDKHLYLLDITDSHRQTWQLRFLYTSPTK